MNKKLLLMLVLITLITGCRNRFKGDPIIEPKVKITDIKVLDPNGNDVTNVYHGIEYTTAVHLESVFSKANNITFQLSYHGNLLKSEQIDNMYIHEKKTIEYRFSVASHVVNDMIEFIAVTTCENGSGDIGSKTVYVK